MADGPLYETIASRAATAALEDHRFPFHVKPSELDHIALEISVLTTPHEVPSPEAIEIGRHGVILKNEFASATFLPQVAKEQGWDRETMLDRLA